MRKNSNKLKKKLRTFLSLCCGKKKRRIPFTFEVHIIDSCNLNCKGCFHFSSLKNNDETAIYDLNEFEKDISRISDLFSKNIGWVHIMGGEPLLNPNAIEYLKSARKILHNADISFLTNGLLLGKNIPLVEYCAQNDITISITKYPVNFSYDLIIRILKEHNCKFEFFGDRTGENKMVPVALANGNANSYKHNFLTCNLSNVCITLDRGKLFYCSVPAYIRIFNDSKNKDYKWQNDFIDIYQNTRKQILDFLRTPHEFCGYCDLKYRKNNKFDWSISKQSDEEWERKSANDK